MGIFSSIGNFMNDISGITGSSNAAFSQSAQLSRMSYGQQKEFAQNAHQWEMDDLRKAGLNPALTAGGSSAGAIAGGGSTGGSSSVGTSAMSPLGIVDAINSSIATNADTKLKDQEGRAQILNALANLKNADTNELIGTSTIGVNNQKIKESKGGMPTKLLGTDEENPLSKIIMGLVSGVGGPGIIGGALKGYKYAKKAYQSYKFGNFIKSISK